MGELKTPEQIQSELDRLKKIKELREAIKSRKDELEWRRKHWSIKYYAVKPDGTFRGPHRQQDKFHRDKNLIRVASGGNRSGKSTSGINEDVAHALGYRPWLRENDPDRKVNVRVPNKGLICGESFGEQVAKVLVPKLVGDPDRGIPGAIPTPELAHLKRNPQGVVTTITLKNGSMIFLQSYDQEVDLFESADYDWAHFDEPPPRSIWVAVQRGLADRSGRTWITMTPLKEPWIYDEVYSRNDTGLFYFDIEDNLEFGLTRQGIDQFSRSLTDDEREARLRGRYFHLTGLVYKSYRKDIHRIKRFTVPRNWPIWMHVDTHPRTPHHAVYIAVGPDERKYVVGAMRNGDVTNKIPPFVDLLRTFEMEVLKRGVDEFIRLIEPASQTPDPLMDGRSIWDAFADLGVRCRPGSKNRDSGILLMQQELQYTPDQGVYPMIYFFDDLEGVHYEMTHYIWDDWEKKAGESKTEKQEPKKKNDHYIEGMHRILLDEPKYHAGEYEEETHEPATSGRSRITGY